jgi:hypothetical protein
MSTVKPKFDHTFCSQCGGEFGPGDNGFSHCSDHMKAPRQDRRPEAWTKMLTELDNSPFITELGETYMRHDELRVTQDVGRIAVQFLWCGKLVYTQYVDGDLSAGHVLELHGEGRIKAGPK